MATMAVIEHVVTSPATASLHRIAPLNEPAHCGGITEPKYFRKDVVGQSNAMNPGILIVDDEPVVRDVMARYLARDGFDVRTAPDGASALEAYQPGAFDLLLLDVMLPEVDGMEVLRRVRMFDRVPVIMLTAKVEEGDRILGLEMGADDYVVKPFSPAEVVARVIAVLRRAAER